VALELNDGYSAAQADNRRNDMPADTQMKKVK
jgi:hypothetical protein